MSLSNFAAKSSVLNLELFSPNLLEKIQITQNTSELIPELLALIRSTNYDIITANSSKY